METHDLFCGLLSQAIESHLKEKNYDESLVPEWIDMICADCMKGLSDLNKPFKYIGAVFAH